MDLSKTIILDSSVASKIPDEAIVTSLAAESELSITIMVRRNSDDYNLQEYADSVIAGINPILSHDELKNRFGATDNDLDLVEQFVESYNLNVVRAYNRGANVIVSGTADNFNNAFNTVLKLVTLPDRSYHNYIGSLSIPEELNGIITHIIGLDDSIRLIKSITKLETDVDLTSSAVSYVTPEKAATAYQWPATDGYGQCVAIVEFGGGFTTQNLNSTFAGYGLAVPTVTFVSVDNGINDPTSADSSEVMLDIAVVGGAVPKAKQVIYTAPNSIASFANCFNAAVNDTVNNPCVISCSWGTYEVSFGSYRAGIDNVYQAAAILGIPVFAATGDYGSEYGSGAGTISVQYPGSSPYVTGCGGTTLNLDTNSTIISEYTWNQGTAGSAGGVSTIYSVPSYQTGLSSKLYPSGTVATLPKRGLPDIGGNADPASGYRFYYGTANTYAQSGGTSATAPLYAALVARLVALTGKRLGFLNNLFYANTNIFNDITTGNNACPLATGYSATTGWDACTGLGSINGQLFYKLIKNGSTFPKLNYGFRPTAGQTYPRRTSGVR